ncbi:MAG: 4-(cytidine 5'-diphospho)-2-C-methyl-D-erythritol kinase [Rickettsiales bacterium]|nr:4-(cytidine 5'-diphospho)-2-C-methyl-D-erythritol kinase [Pseudomonadota bacterium]MDA0967147.1 4-(cytidine 5'-diphospho)-2-C-methyl-D-erythritol kinase [Pseudomonadota bacterium]MDG4544332.1 4-(cytidine 5'-diphospho)-2-C-methyl-D-erythritol kinase [Rickettsiales bacterium]MDG4546462.1 4-(cytidine 5'-diphospho)-2-C-methyl-D-erythritol kinase [Rickettsiales bacterium]MDG4548608.1 4-(cytidine 5'-diphospho)-2-C-methyl-D-erythritol kinase [Rickettsiales bacterium]
MLSNAKLNLYLHITGKFHNGYHKLESLMIPISVCDNIYISFNESNTNHLNINGDYAHLVDKSDNLILEAIDAICEHAQIKPKGVNIYLEKNIPVGAGLGGGSSNAATTLKIMNNLLGLNYSNDTLEKIGLKFGADIPFFIENRPALISGVGNIETLVDVPPLYILLIYPNIPLSTTEVFKYAPFNYSNEMPIINTHSDMNELISLLNICDNELEKNAIQLVPQINDILNVLSEQSGCLLSRMTGSGSTCFGLFKSSFELQNAYNTLSVRYPQWWIRYI